MERNMSLKTVFPALILSLLFAGPLHAASFSGKLVRVLDGDTLEIRQDDREIIVVRLAHIYAPVKDQPFGVAAKNYISRVALNQDVSVQFEDYDLYGRAVAEVFLPDGTNLNKLLVRSGYAWRFEGYSDEPDYSDLEEGAKEARIGLWGVKNPVPPWEWRWLQQKAAAASASGGTDFVCGTKHSCSEMTSCDEAKFYFYACGLDRLDRDGNGIPCDTKCN
jgi:endonuclease YncB( thermonuclease family)